MPDADEHIVKEEVKVKLHAHDLSRIGHELAEETQARNQLDAQRRSLQSTLSAQLKDHETKIAALTAKIMQGYETRQVDCVWLMDTPRTGLKTLVRKDTNEELRTDTMTQADAQLGMDLQPPSGEEPGEKPSSQ